MEETKVVHAHHSSFEENGDIEGLDTAKYLEAAAQQYELPRVSVSLITVLRYATPLETGIQLLGSIMAISGGPLSRIFPC